MKRKYHICLSQTEREEIHELLNKSETPKYIRNRCKVLVHADENADVPPTQAEIAMRCGVSDVTVYTVVKEYSMQGLGLGRFAVCGQRPAYRRWSTTNVAAFDPRGYRVS